jgi:DCN1-like protein 1/2
LIPDRADDDITVDGTLDLCSDLGVDPEDAVLLAVACELQSPSVGRWKKTSWVQGWRGLGCVPPSFLPYLPPPPHLRVNRLTADSVESFEGMKAAIPRLRKKLSADPEYFRRVYLYTFNFARSEGQRSLPIEIALAFWGLLLPLGLKGGALRHQDFGGCEDDDDEDDDDDDDDEDDEDDDDDPMGMKARGCGGGGGWTEDHTQLWFDFLNEKNVKGVSKDTWAMVRGPSPAPPLHPISDSDGGTKVNRDICAQ